MAAEAADTDRGLLKRLVSVLSDIRTLVVLGVGAVAIIFGAGVYYAEASRQIFAALSKVEQHDQLLTAGDLVRQNQLAPLLEKADAALQMVSSGALLEKSAMLNWGAESANGGVSGLNGGGAYPASTCPDGFYVVGIESHGSTPDTRYCVGCLVSVRAICRRLPQ